MIASEISPTDLASFRYFWEDLEPGMVFETAGRTITAADVGAFAGLSGDYNRLHTDDVYAENTPFKQRIAHGLLVGSIMSGLTTRTVMNQFLEPSILGLLEVNFRFPKPAFIGDTISVRIVVADRKETSSADRGIIEFERQGINQHGETVCICMVKMLVARQPADSQNY
ncbi:MULTISPECIES: MaoC family dehydratase [Alcaligenaceae]|uniref:Acyl dehydratase, MaoC family n=1 Tax=Bordetella petrii (strain ATCC BAA-461 / DSM 12804 / CCUG 43448 / CIP 107267 / Se-1111R) TaxID=340100 RepID=A9I343_BORPD|nr:MaoC/PaaZ C-terminal domain-containing protein [Bordetella petrii]CAP44128.1 acyl dehydratase, MaoC family [Bordetella petrii]